MDESRGVTEQLCDFIAERGVARSTDIYEAFPHISTNLHAMLKNPLGNGYLVSCKVTAPDRRGVMREIGEFRVSENARNRSYKEWKAKFDPETRGELKPAKLPPRAAAALAVSVPHETLASPRSPREKGRIERAAASRDTLAAHINRPAVRRTTAPQPEVGKNTGSAGSVAPTSAPFAEACSVAPTPSAERANATADGGDEITATWCLHSDGSMQLAKGDVSLTLAPAEALRFAQLCGLVTPYLADIRPASGTH